MKVLYLLYGGLSEEPHAESQFIAGYESNGATWSGTFTAIPNVSDGMITSEFLNGYIAQGYEMLLRNYPPGIAQLSIFNDAKEKGMLFVSPVGTNNSISYPAFTKYNSVITVGSGKTEYGNATGYPCMFYDEDPIEGAGTDIADIRQCGTVYNIATMKRYSSTKLEFTLTGITDASAIGLHFKGTRVFIVGVTGTDISPTPGGYVYCSYVSGATFRVEFTTTAGTVGTVQTATGGTLTYGDLSSTYALVRCEDSITGFNSYGITLEGITGFSNNVSDGTNVIQTFITGTGWWNAFTILHSLGTGTYEGNGRAYLITQSYSSVYVGGKFAVLKDTLQTSWDDIIGRAIVTATDSHSFKDGYGVINMAPASDLLLDVPDTISLETPELELTVNGAGSVTLDWNIIPFAEFYEIYFNDELNSTVTAHIITKQVTVNRQPKGKRNNFKVRAVSGDYYSRFSNEIEYPYYYYAGILVEEYE